MNLRTWSVLAAFALSACGGGAASSAKPETGGASEETSAPPDEKPAPKPEEAEATGEKSAAPAGESTTLEGDDLEAVLQAVLSDPELLDHLHLDKAGRSPLQISGPGLPEKLKVVAGSYDVKVVAEPPPKKPVMVFTMIERSGDQARVHYRYDIEGIHGAATVNNKNGHWTLGANRVIEK